MDAQTLAGAVIEGVAPGAEEAPAQSGLPSDVADAALSPWERARKDGYLPADFKEDPYELAKSLKNAQDYVTEANKLKGKLGQEAKDAEKAADLKARVQELVPEFIKNGMQLTPEMEAEAVEKGIDIRDLKLDALELRDRLISSYAIVGGEAEYAAMMTTMSEKMSDAEKKAFNADLGGNASKYAIQGLYAEYLETIGHTGQAPTANAPRLEGRVGTPSVKGYASKAEMLADTAYLRSPRGKNDTAARTTYEKRKAATPDSVIYGR